MVNVNIDEGYANIISWIEKGRLRSVYCEIISKNSDNILDILHKKLKQKR